MEPTLHGKKFIQRLCLIGLVCISVFAHKGKAQDTTFSISNVSFKVDTTFMNLMDTLFFTVKNNSTAPYNDFLIINYQLFNSILPSGTCVLPNVMMGPVGSGTDTIRAKCEIPILPINFQIGDNIVVVWSTGNARIAKDSIPTNLYVHPATSVYSNKKINIRIYPAVAQDFISINFPDELKPMSVKIEDISGRVVLAEFFSATRNHTLRVNTSSLNPGVYVVSVFGSDMRSAVSKFIKTE